MCKIDLICSQSLDSKTVSAIATRLLSTPAAKRSDAPDPRALLKPRSRIRTWRGDKEILRSNGSLRRSTAGVDRKGLCSGKVLMRN